VVGIPDFRVYTKTGKVNSKTGEFKKRKINSPNATSRALNKLFLEALRHALYEMGDGGKCLRMLPSATADKKGSTVLKNVEKHLNRRHYYITDIRNAYGSVRLELLAALLVYIFNCRLYRDSFDQYRAVIYFQEKLQEDPLHDETLRFLKCYFSGKYGLGLVFGGVASPMLFNLYAEVFVDDEIRRLLLKRDSRDGLMYTRFADDLVISSRAWIGPDF
jgi:hypothetical protein